MVSIYHFHFDETVSALFHGKTVFINIICVEFCLLDYFEMFVFIFNWVNANRSGNHHHFQDRTALQST